MGGVLKVVEGIIVVPEQTEEQRKRWFVRTSPNIHSSVKRVCSGNIHGSDTGHEHA
jgi:hypothetical protein